MKRIIIKTTIRVVAIVTIMTILAYLTQSPIIANEIALGQMENCAESFVAWELFKTVKPIIGMVLGLAGIWMSIGVAKDIYKYAKTKIKIEDEKENEK